MSGFVPGYSMRDAADSYSQEGQTKAKRRSRSRRVAGDLPFLGGSLRFVLLFHCLTLSFINDA